MNIFFTSDNALHCAQALDNKRLNKMILETAQLLCGAIHHFIEQGDDRLNDAQKAVLYKRTHFNHPSAKFARRDAQCYTWLAEHFTHLAAEKVQRDQVANGTATWHLSWLKLNDAVDMYSSSKFLGEPIDPAIVLEHLAVDDDLKQLKDPFEAYRKHMMRKWTLDIIQNKKLSFGYRKAPDWFNANLTPAARLKLLAPQKAN